MDDFGSHEGSVRRLADMKTEVFGQSAVEVGNLRAEAGTAVDLRIIDIVKRLADAPIAIQLGCVLAGAQHHAIYVDVPGGWRWCILMCTQTELAPPAVLGTGRTLTSAVCGPQIRAFRAPRSSLRH